MKTTIIGLGLIGGSMARDLRATGLATHITGVDGDDAHAARAQQLGLVDEVKTLENAVTGSRLVIVAIPVNEIEGMLPRLLDMIDEKTVVLDTGSTKMAVCKAVRTHRLRGNFVAAHPIAGTENSGPDAAIEGLFRDKVNIICERDLTSIDAMKLAEKVFEGLGMHTTFMEPSEHDKHVAYVSHLSHVTSFLLGQTVLDIERDEKNIFNLAGSGFASTVRLAKSSPDMWAPIFAQNASHLNQALKEYIAHLKNFQRLLEAGDMQGMQALLAKANEIRRVLLGIELKIKDKTTVPVDK